MADQQGAAVRTTTLKVLALTMLAGALAAGCGAVRGPGGSGPGTSVSIHVTGARVGPAESPGRGLCPATAR
jgi:hypothetical protein